MQRFKNILVVVDERTENRAVVERAVTLTQRNQARLAPVPDVQDHCHRPGQTGSGLAHVHIHYLLSNHTMDEQVYDLVVQKWAAQRACTVVVVPGRTGRRSTRW